MSTNRIDGWRAEVIIAVLALIPVLIAILAHQYWP